jgi:hypothetical protein
LWLNKTDLENGRVYQYYSNIQSTDDTVQTTLIDFGKAQAQVGSAMIEDLSDPSSEYEFVPDPDEEAIANKFVNFATDAE